MRVSPPAALLLAGTLLGCEPAEPAYDLLIVGGLLVDGSGGPSVAEDLAIRGDSIAGRGRFAGSPAQRVIDARGRVVAPGFIDMLGHSDLPLLVEPSAASKLHQGITTEITGGLSAGPHNARTRADLTRRVGVEVDWSDFDGYFARLERQGMALNLASYVSATQVRRVVMGEADRPPRPAELARMQRLVRDAMEQGALGLSSGLAATATAHAEELVALARIAAEHGGIYASHLRAEGLRIFQALDESLDVARRAGVPLQLFHLKAAGPQMRGRIDEVVARIEMARAAGTDVETSQSPYVATESALSACIPPWARAGGPDELRERLRDPGTRDRLREEISAPEGDWDDLCRLAGGAEGVLIARVTQSSLEPYQGMRLSDLARAWRKHPIDALFDLLVADAARTTAVFFLTSEDDVERVLTPPWAGVATDSGALRSGDPLAREASHPGAFGSFPRILGRYVREERALSLEEAVRKMTSLAAERVELRNRGRLTPGWHADVVVFDPDSVRELATFAEPRRNSTGVEYVVVNGQLVLDDSRLTGALPGRVLRGPGWRAAPSRVGSAQPGDWACRNDEIERSPSLLVIVPHPDDEVLGFAGPIWSAARAPERRVRVVIVTDGEAECDACRLWKHGRPPMPAAGDPACTPRELDVFGHVRRRETAAALALLGVGDPHDITFLGYVDQSLAHAWEDPEAPPLMAPCANEEPLPEAWRERTGARLLRDLEQILREEQEERVILTTHPLDSHPDHAALFEFVRAAAGTNPDRQIYSSVIHDNAGRPCEYPNPPASSCSRPTVAELRASPNLLSVRRQERYRPESWWHPPDDVDYGTPLVYCLPPELYSGPEPLKLRSIQAFGTQIGLRDRLGRELPLEYRGWVDWRGLMLSFVHRNEVLFEVEGSPSPTH